MTMRSPAVLASAAPVRVMVVDDAVVVRGLISRWVGLEPGLEIVRVCKNGREAVEQFDEARPDVVVLDIDMPELDGIATLKELLKRRPGLRVIMASTLTKRGAEITFRALSLGAADCVPKPDNSEIILSSQEFRRQLIDKIRQLGLRRRPQPVPQRMALRPHAQFAAAPAAPVMLREFAHAVPRALLIGSSTGGPQALQSLIKGLGPALERVPVLIAQHMPPIFTATLAEHLGRISGKPAREGRSGETLQPGHIYVAPGGKHMALLKRPGGPEIVIDDSAPIHFCKPAVDALFLSAPHALDGRVLGIVLTGMGSDGKKGALAIAESGGSVIAQDEATSVIWGMPGAAAQAGACAAVLPLPDIAPRVNRLIAGERS